MELLLNLAWLLLAVPAYWLWRNSRSAGAEYKFSSLQCLLALGCLLVMLFPVISASDDLIAMRTEMEESPLSKRSIRQAGGDKSPLWNSRAQIPPALLGPASTISLAADSSDVPLHPFFPLPAAPALHRAGRAPPMGCLA
ncbi:hypothetical protein SBA1_310033 [Candidatus Sulfotelmatobacter kueseliae]|uniref:Uncharacterized protein n=1 Tax=Candidatus Sulfotelmatobacter kueseliae TaxID=2042962 RepID=A0A2U3KLT1_9BACT|nr:hypothetical protein SBA1_310033 [Candidatus Sulfotelmatobacter kueseliae]